MNTLKITVIFCLAGLILTSCKPQPKKNVTTNASKSTAMNEADRVANMIMDLEEVKLKSAQVEKTSNGKRHLATYIENPPTDTDPNYWVKVAEDNGGSYVTYYTFTVQDKTHKISYYDVLQDSVISIDQCRKTTPAKDR